MRSLALTAPRPAPRPAALTIEMLLFDAPLPDIDPVMARLPRLFRVESLCRVPIDETRHVARAELFHVQAALSVYWVGGRQDTNVARDSLVSIRWLGNPDCCDGAVRIARLVEEQEPEPDVNLFATVPYGWTLDRAALNAAEARWLQTSRRSRRAFNARYWDPTRFRDFVVAHGGGNTSH